MHFWCANLDALLGGVGGFRPLLAADELARASRFHFERDASRYVVCRGILRRLLGSYLGCNPRDVEFSYGAHGKPSLGGLSALADADLRFNVAHTGGFALIGFARRIELGVDVERVHEIPDLDSVMRTAFARGERDRISALPSPTARRDAFFRCWTRKEAVLKALGWGLAKPLDSFEVEFAEDRPRLLSMADDGRAPEIWRLMHLLPAPGFVGAAAWVGDTLEPARFTYES